MLGSIQAYSSENAIKLHRNIKSLKTVSITAAAAHHLQHQQQQQHQK
jgi:hypothetical protein